MAKKKAKKVEKITVKDISQPTPAELALRITVLERKLDTLIELINFPPEKIAKLKG